MSALRCSTCLVNWPENSLYVTCPKCGEKTDNIINADPLPVQEAKSRRLHHLFDAFCVEWDRAHKQPSHW